MEINEKNELDKIFFVYLNAVETDLNKKNIKLAKKHLEKMFDEYIKFRDQKNKKEVKK